MQCRLPGAVSRRPSRITRGSALPEVATSKGGTSDGVEYPTDGGPCPALPLFRSRGEAEELQSPDRHDPVLAEAGGAGSEGRPGWSASLERAEVLAKEAESVNSVVEQLEFESSQLGRPLSPVPGLLAEPDFETWQARGPPEM